MQKTAMNLRRQGKRLGLIPTMGFLHDGHLSLVKLAQEQTDTVILSIFVNPTQFGPNEDLNRYPRDFDQDKTLCQSHEVDILFYPSADDMYGSDHTVYIEETTLSKQLCGASRPGHFHGVLTIVAKLFNLTLPHVAVFGQKDAQQAKLIQQMTDNLNFPVNIMLGPIIREFDGLAMSSRNMYLSKQERQDALCLIQALKLASKLFQQGEQTAQLVKRKMTELINRISSARIDYIEIVDFQTYQPVVSLENPIVVLLAVWIGKTRLIDNLILPDNPLSNLPE